MKFHEPCWDNLTCCFLQSVCLAMRRYVFVDQPYQPSMQSAMCDEHHKEVRFASLTAPLCTDSTCRQTTGKSFCVCVRLQEKHKHIGSE